MLAFFTFATPLMLGALAMMTLPLIAHLMHRHAKRRVVFPTVQFLKESSAAQSQLFRLRRWILLALRCLFVALIVLAFARPAWESSQASADSSKSAAMVIVLDASASTRQTLGGVRLFDSLTASAARSLGALRSGVDLANIVYVDAAPRSALPRLSQNLPALRDELRAAQPTWERADFGAALTMAGEMLKSHHGPRRVTILSDLQTSNWQELIRQAKSTAWLPAETEISFVKPGAAVPDNLSLSLPRCQPRAPLTGQAAQLIVQVSNHSPLSKEARLQVTLDGKGIASPVVALAAGEQQDVAVETTFEDASLRQVEFKLATDGLEADNKAFLTIRPREKLQVVIVSDDSPDEAGTAAFYLKRALAPTNDVLDRFEIRHLSSRSLSAAALGDAAAVFVGYLGQLSPESATALVEHVRQGGGVVVFCGQGAVRRNLLTLNAAADGEALPWQAGGRRQLGRRDEALAITAGRWRSPLLREFDEQSQLGIANIRFRQTWTAGAEHPESQILLTFDDGSPALGMRRIGAGRLLVANFSPDASTSDLGKHGAFVALTQMLAKELRPSASVATEAIVGRPYRHPSPLRLAEDAEVKVVGPGGVAINAVLTPLADGQMTWQIPRPRLPGIYTVEQAGRIVEAAAINVDPREGNLARVELKTIEESFQGRAADIAAQEGNAWASSSDVDGRPLWGWLMLMALAVIGLELFLLSWWRR